MNMATGCGEILSDFNKQDKETFPKKPISMFISADFIWKGCWNEEDFSPVDADDITLNFAVALCLRIFFIPILH